MKSPRIPVLPLVAILALPPATGSPAPAGAQSRADVRPAPGGTADPTPRAQEVVGGTDNLQAQGELSFAIRIQADARTSFTNGRLALALDLTMRARLHADRAIALIKGLPDPDRVLAQLERTRELLDRARER